MMRVNSFISSFKKFVLLPVLFSIMLYASNYFFEYILVSDISSYTRVMFHELYSQEENIDILFLGSSHCYRSLNTQITDNIFKGNTFNGGTSSQGLDGSYTILVEAGKRNDLEKVYVELYYELADEVYAERSGMTATYIISDYLRPSMNKTRFLLEASKSDYWINGFFKARRNWRKLFEKEYIHNLLLQKHSQSYRSYDYPGNSTIDEEYYAGKGYVASNLVIKKNGFCSNIDEKSIPEKIFSEDNLRSLKRIILYCKKHDIELVFFSAPMSDYKLIDVGNYDFYIEQVNEILKEYGVVYYDFNLCRPDYFSYASEMFKDSGHLNFEGGSNFSIIFSEFFMGRISEEKLFYSSYYDKIMNQSSSIYGLKYNTTIEEETTTYSFKTVQNKEIGTRIVIYKMEEGNSHYKKMREETMPAEVSFDREEHGKMLIQVYANGEEFVETTLQY